MDQGQSARLLQAAKARGVTTSFDLIAPNEETLELLRPLLPSVDYFILRWRKPPFSPERRSRRPSAASSWRSAWAPAF